MDATAETLFRITLGILVFVGWGIRLYFQKRVKGVERVSSRHERREKFFYKLVAVSFIPLLLYVFTPWLDFARLPLPMGLRWLGGIMAAAGTALFGWSHQTLGPNWSGILELSKDHALVTEGPYRYVRHPMYSAFFMLGIGLFLLSANGLIGVTHLGSIILMYLVRVTAEEEMMLGQFGDAYRHYMNKTGRLFPRLRKNDPK